MNLHEIKTIREAKGYSQRELAKKGDVVFTPFMGIGSEVFQAVKMERKGIGFELKESYYDLAKKNLAHAVESKKQLSLI